MYALNPSLVLRFEPQFYSTYAAFDFRRVVTCFYRRWEFEVLDYLARNPSGIDELCANLKADRKRLKDFLASQLRRGFVLEVDGGEGVFTVEVPARADPDAFEGFPAPFLSAPSTVDIFLTRACNLRCHHCFSNGGRPLRNELSFEELESILNQLQAVGVLQVRLNGGEPFMHRRIYDILSHLKRMRYQKVILTNGTMLDEKAIDALVDCGITPTISVDGPTAAVHDDFRGVPGAFVRTLRALELLQRRGVTYGINTCVNSENIEQIEDMIRVAIKHRAARIGLLGLAQVGRLALTKRNMVTPAEYAVLSLTLPRLARKYKGKIEVSEMLVSRGVPVESAGTFTCSIDSDGSVYPANLVLGDSRFRVGSLRESCLRCLWFSPIWIRFRRGPKKFRTLGLEQVSREP